MKAITVRRHERYLQMSGLLALSLLLLISCSGSVSEYHGQCHLSVGTSTNADIQYKDTEGLTIAVDEWRPIIPGDTWDNYPLMKADTHAYCRAVDNSARGVYVAATMLSYFGVEAGGGGSTATLSFDPWRTAETDRRSTVAYRVEGSSTDIEINWKDNAEDNHQTPSFDLSSNGNAWEISFSPRRGNVLHLDIADYTGNVISIQVIVDGHVVLQAEGSNCRLHATLSPS